MRIIFISVVFSVALRAADPAPIARAWLINPAAASTPNPALRAVLPNVQSVHADGNSIYVASAGLALQSLGEFEANDRPPEPGPRKFVFRFPLAPQPSAGPSQPAPLGVIGAFLNGVPFYNPTSPISYRDQNLWHLDAVASLRRNVRADAPLLQSLLTNTGRHSPLIGFALDGYPVYGPHGWDGAGKPQRMRSSYRLRTITRRTTLPDGTVLTPSQEGPPVDAEFPLGTFVEDYEFAANSGDLDEHNGRLTRTPEYPDGTYAYFLTTYPYLVGPTYYGSVDFHASAPKPGNTRPIELNRAADLLTFTIRDDHGRKLRFLEKTHEQPIHLLVVSSDLAEFAHIHPQLQDDGTYTVRHHFLHGGTYWLYAGYVRPGAAQSILRFRLDVAGTPRPFEPLRPDTALTKTQDGLTVKLTLPKSLRAGEDLHFGFDLSTDDLQPYLGAWAHIMIVSQDREEFIHAHPLEDNALEGNPWQHTHTPSGPSPGRIETVTGFRKPGLYRLWVQFQREGKVITIPYTIKVEPPGSKRALQTRIPAGAIRIKVDSSGFTPARIDRPEGKPAVLAFQRSDAQNCAGAVVFPELHIRKPLPPGETVLIDIPASAPRELHFACGMGMYRGALVVR